MTNLEKRRIVEKIQWLEEIPHVHWGTYQMSI